MSFYSQIINTAEDVAVVAPFDEVYATEIERCNRLEALVTIMRDNEDHVIFDEYRNTHIIGNIHFDEYLREYTALRYQLIKLRRKYIKICKIIKYYYSRNLREHIDVLRHPILRTDIALSNLIISKLDFCYHKMVLNLETRRLKNIMRNRRRVIDFNVLSNPQLIGDMDLSFSTSIRSEDEVESLIEEPVNLILRHRFNRNVVYGQSVFRSYPIVQEVKFRSIMLLTKLRSICRQLRMHVNYYVNYKQYCIDNSIDEVGTEAIEMSDLHARRRIIPYENYSVYGKLSEPIFPEMEEPSAHGVEEVKLDQKSNVILTENRVESESTTASFAVQSWTSYCSSEITPNYNEIVDRWILIDTFDWSKDDSSGIKKRYRLPYEMVKNEPVTPCRMPNTLPFTIHRYWRGDMEIKIQVNSNKFQIGSLQCAWLYSPDFDDSIDMRENVYSLSQTDHVLISASASNEAKLIIPYKYHLPYIHTKPRADMPKIPLNLGSLYISVLNPLTVSEGGSVSANVSVFIRTFNNEFTGMISGDIDKIENVVIPEMDRIMDTGLGILSNFFPDRNRDNPSRVRAPDYLVPTASHSWSVGNNMAEPIHPLRLDGSAQTPHPSGIEVNNEMTIDNLKQIFGLVKTIEWNKDQAKGAFLLNWEAAPFMNSSIYNSLRPSKDNMLSQYAFPPLAVLSSFFMGWRGTIEFRFDIVCSQFHTGRLLCGYIPGVTSITNISINQLRASSHMVFSLQENHQFSFVVPYIANKPVWPRLYSGDYDVQDAESPSRIYLAVLNKLVPMQSVSNTVYINIYMRAGEDFEFVVPVQPSLGLGYNNKYEGSMPVPTVIQAIAGYSPYYSGAFEDFTNHQVFRWGTLSHQIAEFNGANYYVASDRVSYCVSNSADLGNLPTVWDGNSMQAISYVLFIKPYQLGYVVGIPCPSERNVIQLSKLIFIDRVSLNDPRCKDLGFSPILPTTSNTFSKTNIRWVVKNTNIPKDLVIYPEIGERSAVSNIVSLGTSNTISNGRLLFGERFNDLKDLCRRYQYYGDYYIASYDYRNSELVQFSFPALVTGLDPVYKIGTNIKNMANRCREGHIPIIASGYRFYRGSLRFRIVVDPKLDFVFYIQHRPDRRLVSRKIEGLANRITGDAVLNHTYASYVQLTAVNGIVEFEVPYYLFGMYGLLQHPKLTSTDEGNYFSLGEICIGIQANSSTEKDVKGSTISIFYSIADDMSFSTFQGFPRMVMTSDIPSFPLVQEIQFRDLVFPEMGWFSDKVTSYAKDSVKEEAEKLTDLLKSKFGDLKLTTSEGLAKIGLEIMHMIADPSIKTIALGTIKILMDLGLIVVNNLYELVSSCMDTIVKWLSSISNEPLADTTRVDQVLPEMGIATHDSKNWIGLVGLLFGGVTTALALNCDRPSDVSSFTKFATKTIPLNFKGTSFVMSFLLSISDVVKRISKYVINRVYPVEGWFYDIESDIPEIKLWADEIMYLGSLDLEVQLDQDGILADRIYYAHNMGTKLICKYINSKDSNMHLIYKLQEKIERIYEKARALGKHPFVRKEPFCLWMCGAPGIGKSFLTEYISSELLKAINYRLKGPKIFTVMPSGDFWTGCKNQPVLNMDDAFAVEISSTLEKQLNTMYMVKSPVSLNPPMANLEDKNLRYNPEIFYINSNKSFLNLAGVHTEAIHRRRDCLIQAQLVKGKKMSDFTREQLKKIDHLEFFVAGNVMDEKNPQFDGPYTYNQLIDMLKVKFVEFHANEMENYQDRLDSYDGIQDYTPESLDDIHINDLRTVALIQRHEDVQRYRAAVRNSLYGKLHGFDVIDYSKCSMRKLGKFMHSLFGENSVEPEMEEIEVEVHAPATYAEMMLGVDDYDEIGVVPPIPSDKGTLRDVIQGYVLDIIKDKFTISTKQNSTFTMLTTYINTIPEWTIKPSKLIAIGKFLEQIRKRSTKFYYNKIHLMYIDISTILFVAEMTCDHYRAQKIEYEHDINGEGYWKFDGTCVRENGYCIRRCLCSSSFMWALFNLYTNNICVNVKYFVATKHEKAPYFWKTVESIAIKKDMINWLDTLRAKAQFWYNNTFSERVRGVLSVVMKLGSLVLYVIGMYYGVKSISKLLFSDRISERIGHVCSYGAFKMALKNNNNIVDDAFAIAEGAYALPTKISKWADNTIISKTIAPQGSVNYQNMIKIINRNSIFIVAKYYNASMTEISVRARCLGIEMNRVLCIRHYHDSFMAMPENARYYVEYYNKGIHYVEIDYRNLKTDSFVCKDQNFQTNYFLLYLPPQIPPFRKIVNYFAKAKDHEYSGRTGTLIEHGVCVHANVRFELTSDLYISPMKNMEGVRCLNAYTYGIHGSGMCGSILLSDNIPNAPIIGLHVAGGSKTGYSEVIYREMLEQCAPLIPSDIDSEGLEKILVEDKTPYIQLDTAVEILGVVKPEMAHRETGKTQLVPSEIYGVFPVRTEPNPLSPSDKRLPKGSHPLRDGCNKHGIPNRPFSKQNIEIVATDMWDVLRDNVLPQKKISILSLEEAICGIPELDHYESLEWNTSPGFGYNVETKKGKGKKWLFDLELKQDGYELKGLHPHLVEVLKDKQEKRERGIIPTTVFVDCLKDATLPIEKCKVPGKTRIFSISPVDYTIDFKRYCGDFLAAYTKARFDAEHAVGINCDSNEWTDLVNLLLSKSDRIVTGDYTNFGPGLSLDVVNAAFEIIVKWYEHHGASKYHIRMIRMLNSEMLNCTHLCGDLLYRVFSGIASGSPITAPLNCIVNSMYIRLTWLDIMKGTKYVTMQSFRYMCRLVTYGDDLIMSVRKEVIDRFNIQTIGLAFYKYDIRFTDARKSDNLSEPYTSILQSSFLSRDFIPHPTRYGKWLAGLKKVSIEGCVNWVRIKSTDKWSASRMNTVQCLQLAYGWGPEYFNQVRDALLQAWAKRGSPIVLQQWVELDKLIFDDTINAFREICLIDF